VSLCSLHPHRNPPHIFSPRTPGTAPAVFGLLFSAANTIQEFPEFPDINYELGYRKVVSKETQLSILEEVHKISYHINPKIWIGIKWLCTYISIRPGELVLLTEGDIDLDNGYLFFPHPKEKRHKVVPIIKEDIEILKTFPPAMPKLPFFRHTKGSGQQESTPFGGKVFYNWWKKACKNLGIEDVDLYGGTKHSSARALRKYCSPEQIRRATMHSTKKAFERYFRIESEEVRDVYEITRTAKDLRKNSGPGKKAKILIIK